MFSICTYQWNQRMMRGKNNLVLIFIYQFDFNFNVFLPLANHKGMKLHKKYENKKWQEKWYISVILNNKEISKEKDFSSSCFNETLNFLFSMTNQNLMSTTKI